MSWTLPAPCPWPSLPSCCSAWKWTRPAASRCVAWVPRVCLLPWSLRYSRSRCTVGARSVTSPSRCLIPCPTSSRAPSRSSRSPLSSSACSWVSVFCVRAFSASCPTRSSRSSWPRSSVRWTARSRLPSTTSCAASSSSSAFTPPFCRRLFSRFPRSSWLRTSLRFRPVVSLPTSSPLAPCPHLAVSPAWV